MVNPIEKALRFGERREERRAQELVKAILDLEPLYEEMSDAELRSQTDDFKDRVSAGESLDILLPEAFAVAREASDRVLGKKQYPVQLLGGIALHFGQVAEMGTGEGKAVTVDTLIPTPEGAIPAGEIVVGDTIYAGSGELTVVSGVFPQGSQQVYRVHFEDGRFIDCNLEHLWDVRGKYNSYETVTTGEIIERLDAGERLFVPMQGATASKMPMSGHVSSILDPSTTFTSIYLGYSRNQRTGDSSPAWTKLRELIDEGAIIKTPDYDNSCTHYQVNITALQALPDDCNLNDILANTIYPAMPFGSHHLAGSEKQIALLMKHLAVRQESNKLTALAWSEAAADSIAWVARSMGWHACVYPSSGVLAWAVDINKKPKSKVGIIAVENLGRSAEQVCFTVTHPSHLFLAGDHIVTHNTLTAVAPMYLNALTGKGAHLVTTNDYLAREQEE